MAEEDLWGGHIPLDKRGPETSAAGFFHGFVLDKQRGVHSHDEGERVTSLL